MASAAALSLGAQAPAFQADVVDQRVNFSPDSPLASQERPLAGDLAPFLSLVDQVATPELGTALLGALQGDPQSNAAREALRQVPIGEGLNYAVAQLLVAPDNQQINQALQALHKAATAGVASLSEAEQAHLQKLGLGVERGRVINLANGDAVSAAQLSTLARIADQRLTGPGASRLASARAVQSRNPVIAAAMADLAQVQLERVRTQTALARAKQAADTATGLQEQVADKLVEATELQETAEQFSQRAEDMSLLSMAVQTGKPEQEIANLIAQRGEPYVRELLGSVGLSYTGQGEALQLQSGGQAITGPELETVINQGKQQFEAQGQAVLSDLSRVRHELSALQAASESATATAVAAAAEMDSTHQSYQQALAQSQASFAQLQALRQDPAAWAQLSPEEQQQVEGLIQDFAQEHKQGREISQQVQAQGEQIRELAARCREQGQQVQRLLPLLDHSLNNLEKALKGATPAHNAEEAAFTRHLIDMANELQATLDLAPRPKTEDVSRLFSEWLASLSSHRESLRAETRAADQRQGFEQALGENAAAQRLRQLDYHLEQLQQFDVRQSERIENLLRESLSLARAF